MVKYTLPLRAFDDIAWRVDIVVPGYSANPVILKGVSEACAILAYDGDTDDPYSVFIVSTLELKVYNTGQINVSELQLAATKDIKVNLYRENTLKWTGYLISKGIQQPFLAVPYALDISASDGLSLLEDIPYTHNNLFGKTAQGVRNPINYIRQILFAEANLGLPLPLRWTNNIQNPVMSDPDVMGGDVSWSTAGEGFYSYQEGTDGTGVGPTKSCRYVLEGMLKAFQCRLYQADGKWIIRRVNDIAGLSDVSYRETPGNLGMLDVEQSTENLLKLIGKTGYRFMGEDQVMTTKPGVRSAKITYEADIKENILPNGNQDIISVTAGGVPFYWGSYDENIQITSVDPLDGREGGYATEIVNFSGDGDTDTKHFNLVRSGGTLLTTGLPINTKTLVKRISFGFTFMPQNGFPFNAENGIIVWDTNPLEIQVIFTLNGAKYYLNEFGFWVNTDTKIAIVIQGLKIDDIARVDFDKFQGILLPSGASAPVAGSSSDIQVVFLVKDGQKYTVDNIYMAPEQAFDVYESVKEDSLNMEKDERSLSVSSSFGGYMVSNFMTSWAASDEECFFNDGLIYEGTLTGLTANAIMRFRYKPSRIYNGTMNVRKNNWSFDEMYVLDTLGPSVFLPLNAKYNIETCQVFLVAMESRNDNVIFTEKYYSSNDKQLSN